MQGEFLRGPEEGNLYLKMVMEEKAQYEIRDFWEVRWAEVHSIRPYEREQFTNYGVDHPGTHFDKFPTPQTFSCWRIRFKTEMCFFFSNFPTEAMLWIKAGEMTTSVDDFKSSRSIQGITPFPDFELLVARIVSSLNKIIPNSYFKKKVRLEEQKAQKADWFFRGRQIADLIYDYFRVTGVNDSVLEYADFISVVLRNGNMKEFNTRWDEMLLSVKQFPPDDILESLYKLRTRESEKLKIVLELYNLEIHQKKSKPDFHPLKTMVKRSIEHDLRTRNFEARNGRIESNMLVKNQREQCRVLKGQGDCWQWKAIGQCPKETIAVSGTIRLSEPNLRPSPLLLQNIWKIQKKRKVPEAEARLGESIACHARTIWKVLARIPLVKSGIFQSVHSTNVRNAANSGISAHSHTAGLRNNLTKDLKEVATKVQLLCRKETQNLDCVFEDVEAPRSSSILRKSSTTTKPIRCVRFSPAVLRNAKLRDHKPSLNKICPGNSHQRSANAPKFEDRSQEETERARALGSRRSVEAGKENPEVKRETQSCILLADGKVVSPSPSKIKLEEREFVVDSRASMHMIKQKRTEFCRAGDC